LQPMRGKVGGVVAYKKGDTHSKIFF